MFSIKTKATVGVAVLIIWIIVASMPDYTLLFNV